MVEIKAKREESTSLSGPGCRCACYLGDGFLHGQIRGDYYWCGCFCIPEAMSDWNWSALF